MNFQKNENLVCFIIDIFFGNKQLTFICNNSSLQTTFILLGWFQALKRIKFEVMVGAGGGTLLQIMMMLSLRRVAIKGRRNIFQLGESQVLDKNI